ncbi:unnamed protein product [Tuber aestivum]|uniref:Uncharacterized protein n=1 Tax=Tuber aestivum TaxID=59557 RepID=A0A292PQV2_9PEZI|nr:unnamed protein product [Tuber aestivum]
MSSGSPSNANSPADTQATSVSPPGETDYSPTEPIKVEDTEGGFSNVPVDKMKIRLDFLIKQSGIYTSIIGEKMMQQQQAMRKRAEAIDKKQKAEMEEEAAKADGSVKVENVRKSSRTAGASSTEQESHTTKAKRRLGRPAKKETANISDYFTKDELKGAGNTAQALASAVEEAGETKLGQQKDLKSARQPKLITGGIMKEYQLQGLEWLVSLYENGLNGILADEMGLGKTLQTISFLAFLREKGMMGPFLVVAPVSTLSNWVEEIARFAPEIPAVLYHGTPPEREEIRRTRMARMDARFPVICTSYELVMIDRKHLKKHSWKFIIIDEGHRIKNLNCKLISELKKYKSANRLLLTGTPLQNNLSELWSLLNFLLPDIFDDLASFQDWFNFNDLQEKEGHHAWLEEEKKVGIVASLHAILKPFLLRRIKADVETNLPPKREYILYAPLTMNQKDLYGMILDRKAKEWLIEQLLSSRNSNKKRKLLTVGQESPNKRAKSPDPKRKKKCVSYKELSDDEYFEMLEEAPSEKEELEPALTQEEMQILQATQEIGAKKLQNPIMQLRLACDSPHLFYWPWDQGDPDERLVTASGKMMLLERLVPALFARGHKVLIFSQFTRMLDILEEWAVTLRNWPVCRIDGGIKQEDRREHIRRFNKEEGWNIFLLSTRAGGLGINLTAADTVILFDSDWNPQQDLQAQDRAHRIGQKRPVIIYRFATAATIEQSILEKADGKRRLEKLVIQKGKFRSVSAPSAIEEEEIAQILKEDFEKVNVVEQGTQLLTDAELETLMDRSPEAYARAAKGKEEASGAFRVVETGVNKEEVEEA